MLWQNIGIAVGVEALLLVLTLAETASLWTAVLAGMGQLVVIANGARVLRRPAHGTRADCRQNTVATLHGA